MITKLQNQNFTADIVQRNFLTSVSRYSKRRDKIVIKERYFTQEERARIVIEGQSNEISIVNMINNFRRVESRMAFEQDLYCSYHQSSSYSTSECSFVDHLKRHGRYKEGMIRNIKERFDNFIFLNSLNMK